LKKLEVACVCVGGGGGAAPAAPATVAAAGAAALHRPVWVDGALLIYRPWLETSRVHSVWGRVAVAC
jgi:hypothetical protein